MLLNLSLPALTCVACRTKVRLKIALKTEFLRHFFVFHLVDHLSLSMTGALKCVLFEIRSYSTIQIIVIYFCTAMSKKINKKSNQLVFVENKLLSPSAQQSLRLKVNGLS